MEWFSLWLPLVSQLVVPVSLLAWLAFERHATKARSFVVAEDSRYVLTRPQPRVQPLRNRSAREPRRRTGCARPQRS